MTAASEPAHHEPNTSPHTEFAPHSTETPSRQTPTLTVTAVSLSLKTRSGESELILGDSGASGAEIDVPWWLSVDFRFFEPEPH